MYGEQPSAPAVHAASVFREAGARTVLELGTGHGRDALYFAREDFNVSNLDGSGSVRRHRRRCCPGPHSRRGTGTLAARVLGFSRVVTPPLPGGGTPWA